VVFPHWGSNYRWANAGQTSIAHDMIDAGADLILGHGAHMLQEVEFYRGRWIVYSLGNFMFNTRGRYGRNGAPPFSLLASLIHTESDDDIGDVDRTLRLYPTVTDNLQTGFQSRAVNEQEFRRVERLLTARSPSQDEFRSRVATARDELGWYLEMEVAR